MSSAELKGIIYAAAITPHTTRPGLHVLSLPSGEVFHCELDGSMGTRPVGYDGKAESAQLSGNTATYQPDDGGPFFTFAVAPVDKL